MRVEDVMTKSPWTVRPDTSLKEVAEILVGQNISGVPVVDSESRVVGVVSEGDILLKETGGVGSERGFLARLLSFEPLEELKLDARTAAEAMTAPAITITRRRPVTEAAAKMLEEGVKRLPVVDEEGKLVGIVTRADLVRAFVRSDQEIESEIREDVIGRTLWLSPDTIAVEVDKGEVRLSGVVGTKADAELVPAFVQRVPGVVGVLSKLRWEDENGSKQGRLLLWHKQP